MNKLVICVVALCVAQCAVARVVREAPAPATSSPLSEIASQAQEAVSKLHTAFLDFWGVKDNAELGTLVETQSKTYAGRLQNIFNDLSEEAKKNSGKFDGIVSEIKTKISDTIKDIETKNPALIADSKKYQEQFEQQLRSVLSETEKFSAKLKSEGGEFLPKFEKVAKDLYDTTVSTAKQVTTQVQTTLAEKKA